MTRSIAPYAEWAHERLALDPDAELGPDEARADYLAWASDRRERPEPRSRQRAAVRAIGARCRGTGAELRYAGVRLVGPIPDSGYRTPTLGAGPRSGEPADPMPALLALHAAGLVADGRALDQAWLRLTGTPARALCPSCGQVSRREAHASCLRARGLVR